MYAVAITDIGWFEFLRSHNSSEVINFWTPTPWGIRKLESGSKFYFFLKLPYRKIAGSGNFVKYSEMTIQESWDRYGYGNGCENFNELKVKIRDFLGSPLTTDLTNHKIGCIELTGGKFLNTARIFNPSRFSINIPRTLQRFTYFDGEDPFEEYLNEHGKP
jgi:putative restriction endonuclease